MKIVFDMDSRIVVTCVDGREDKQILLEMPEGCIEEGIVQDVEKLATFLRSELPLNEVKSCGFVLPDSCAIFKEITLPKLKKKAVNTAVYAKLLSELHGDKDVVIDYVTQSDDSEKGGMLSLLCTIVRKETIRSTLELASKLGLKCEEIDLRFSALRKYLAERGFISVSPIIVANITPAQAEVNLFEGNRAYVKTAAISKKEDTDGLLKDWALSYNDTMLEERQDNDQIVEIVGKQIWNLLQFQLSRNSSNPVTSIYIYGTIPELNEIIELYGGAMDIAAQRLCIDGELPFVNVKGAFAKKTWEVSKKPVSAAKFEGEGFSVG